MIVSPHILHAMEEDVDFIPAMRLIKAYAGMYRGEDVFVYIRDPKGRKNLVRKKSNKAKRVQALRRSHKRQS